MHIPEQDTHRLTIIPFSAALEEAFLPCPEYDVSKWLYVPNRYADYRYLLGQRGARPLVCVGVNPSTAAPDRLDNTLKSVQRIALHNGYDSFLMFNVYAQRATRPRDMDTSCNRVLHAENMAAFRYALSLSRGAPPAVWAAWGNVIETRAYLSGCVRDLLEAASDMGAKWYMAGNPSVKGHPHHPLYLKKDTPLVPFDAAGYLTRLLSSQRPKKTRKPPKL